MHEILRAIPVFFFFFSNTKYYTVKRGGFSYLSIRPENGLILPVTYWFLKYSGIVSSLKSHTRKHDMAWCIKTFQTVDGLCALT